MFAANAQLDNPETERKSAKNEKHPFQNTNSSSLFGKPQCTQNKWARHNPSTHSQNNDDMVMVDTTSYT